MPLVDLIILALATWRLVLLVQQERGPFAGFTRLRERLGVAHDEDGAPISWPDTELGRLIRCCWCGSVWVGIGLAGVYMAWPMAATVLALPFALSAGALIVEVIVDGKSTD